MLQLNTDTGKYEIFKISVWKKRLGAVLTVKMWSYEYFRTPNITAVGL